LTASLYVYPRRDRKIFEVKTFATSNQADEWLRAHNHELNCIVPDYSSDVVSYAERHVGEDMRKEMTLF
jgi:hypothetical protein